MRAFTGMAVLLVCLGAGVCRAQLQMGGRGPISLPQKKQVSAPRQSPGAAQPAGTITSGQLRQLAAAYQQMNPKERKKLAKALKQQLKQQNARKH